MSQRSGVFGGLAETSMDLDNNQASPSFPPQQMSFFSEQRQQQNNLSSGYAQNNNDKLHSNNRQLKKQQSQPMDSSVNLVSSKYEMPQAADSPDHHKGQDQFEDEEMNIVYTSDEEVELQARDPMEFDDGID